MTTKEQLLALLESSKGTYFSGEEIARRLCVSRAAVWKAVKSLQNEGYEITAVTNKGYCLAADTDILSVQGVQKYLDSSCRDLEIVVLPTAESTNTLVRQKAAQGGNEGYTVISNEQTRGRGRYGRPFFSPGKTGIYLSILLKPAVPSSEALSITTMAAVAMCKAMEEVSQETVQIKWVNDIYIRGKKVCGILTEAALDLESGMLEYAVLGVGVNVYTPQGGFPEDLRDTAGAVFSAPGKDAKNRLTAAFLNHFMSCYRGKNSGDYIAEYRRRNLVIGRKAVVYRNGIPQTVDICGIDDACRLIVRYDNHETAHLSYGEIQLDQASG